MAPGPACSSSSSIRVPTRGWTIEFSVARRSASSKTISPSLPRSRLPSPSSTPGPNAATTSASPGVPGATTSLAMASASITTAPCAARRRETSLLPAPIPPVRPTRSTGSSSAEPTWPYRRRSVASADHVNSRVSGDRRPADDYACQPAVRAGRRSASALAAGQLVPQRGESLVGGQRAHDLGLRLLDRAAPVIAGRVCLGGVGLAGGGYLLLMRLIPRPRLGVLPLPFLALGVIALQPLARLGVEAVGVDVVALLVVGGRHAVEGRVEVLADRLADRALVGLLQRQADPAPVQVDVDDLDEDLVADLHHLLGNLHMPVSQLGDVHQALDALLDPHERAERHQLGDPARHDLADLVRPGELLPGVLLRRLQRQRDPLAVHVHVQDLDGDLLADLDDLARVVHVLPGQLGDVHQAIHAAQVDERAEVDDGRDDALADLALLQRVQEVLADLGLRLLQPGPAGQDHVVAVLVQLDDLGLDLLAHVRLQIADPAHLHQRGGQEAAQPDVQDQAALDDLDHGAGDDAVLVLDLLDRAPGALVLRALLGQDQPALLVLLLQDQGLDVLAVLDDIMRIDIVLDRQLAGRDDAFGLVADVEQDLIPVDLDDCPFDNIAVVEILDGLVDRGEEGLLGTDVVDRYLGGRGGLGAARGEV